MEENFSPRVKQILSKIEEISETTNIKSIGSEYLLFAMYEISDSLCHFLLNEYCVTKEELITQTHKLIILRSHKNKYNQKLEDLLVSASNISPQEISDEHIFMAILNDKSCIAYDLLIKLGLDIEDLKEDVKEIYDFDKTKEISFTTSITKKAINKEINDFINIEKYVERVMTILNRKNKNNPILVGNAGVGKTALVEGIAKYMVDNNIKSEIISLSLASMLAGTKYRGDFEKRVDDIVTTISKKKNVILFIDEIHTIVGAGTTENSLDIANMLKPFLARSDFKVIGATTPSEYHKTIEKDKALNRRFQSIFIKEPNLEETTQIIKGIKDVYLKYHSIILDDDVLNYLIKTSDYKIKNKFRPDKCIDVLDELLSYCSIKQINNITNNNVDFIIDKILGYEQKVNDFNFKIMNKFCFFCNNNLNSNNTLFNIGYKGNEYGLNLLLNDFKSCFGITDEMILNLDMKSYNQNHLLSSLIGSPPGYVGYSDEGLLSKHILKYPMSIVYLKNYSYAASSVKALFEEMGTKGSFYDRLGNKINTSNLILITNLEEQEENNIGFNSVVKEDNTNYDEVIVYDKFNEVVYNDKYKSILRKMNIEASIEFDITSDLQKQMNDIVYDVHINNIDGVVEFYKEEDKIMYKKDLVN